MFRTLLTIVACTLATPALAQVSLKIYAQELVDQTAAGNPDLLTIVMHVTPPKSDLNVIVASNIGRIGKPGDEDDLRVIETGKSHVGVRHSGKRYEVELAMLDVSGGTIGALGLVWAYREGQDKSPFEVKAEKIRDGLARRILNIANLMDPYPFDARATTRTNAQKLVEQTVLRHPDITVLALRGTPLGTRDLVVLGSTFGRHGKKADADDLRILDSTEPVSGIYSNGKRFGVDLQLRDAVGRVVGTMNVGYMYREGDDRDARLAKAVELRKELQPQIASAQSLAELDP